MSRKPRKKAQRNESPDVVLRAVPYRNEAMEITDRPDGGLVASIPMRRPKFLVPPISWLLPYSSHRRVQLDALGAGVLRMCDGKSTVETLIERFASQHQLTFREAQISVTQFLRQMAQRGLVAIIGKNRDMESL